MRQIAHEGAAEPTLRGCSNGVKRSPAGRPYALIPAPLPLRITCREACQPIGIPQVEVSPHVLLYSEALVSDHVDEGNRRDFLVVAGNAFAAVGAASLLWPFVQQMNPDASAKALASTEIDLSPVKEGQAITVMWRGKPVFIRNRTKEEIEEARRSTWRLCLTTQPRTTRCPRLPCDRRQPGQEGP